jgi:hypothetical protein
MPSTYSVRSERYAYIETKGRQYARSGDHSDYRTIEALLIKNGYPEARKVFANLWTQHELNRICQRARSSDRDPEDFLRLAHLVSG